MIDRIFDCLLCFIKILINEEQIMHCYFNAANKSLNYYRKHLAAVTFSQDIKSVKRNKQVFALF